MSHALRAPLLAAIGLLGLTASIAAGEAANATSLTTQTVNVLGISFDPVLKTRQSLKLHQYMKWADPWKLTDEMVDDARVCSGGYVDYRVVEKIDFDGFTTFRDGFAYTEETFLEMWERANQGMTSFKWLFQKFDLAAKMVTIQGCVVWNGH